MRLWACGAALTAAVTVPAVAQDAPELPDPASIIVPNLSSNDPSVVSNGYKFFAFRKAGVDFATAAHDLAECRGFLPSGAARGLPSFVPWVEAVNRPVQNNVILTSTYPLGQFIEANMKAALAAIILPKMERGLRNNKMRRCMEPRGYLRVAVPEAAWNEMNEGDDELKMVLMQARVASSSSPTLVEIRENGE